MGFKYKSPHRGWQRPRILDFRKNIAVSCCFIYHFLPFVAFWLVRSGGPTQLWGFTWSTDFRARAPWSPLWSNSLVVKYMHFLSFLCEPGLSISKWSMKWWLEVLAISLHKRLVALNWEYGVNEKDFKGFISSLTRKGQGKTHCSFLPDLLWILRMEQQGLPYPLYNTVLSTLLHDPYQNQPHSWWGLKFQQSFISQLKVLFNMQTIEAPVLW